MTQAAILAASGSPGTTTGFKNRIINGNMVVNQYNAATLVTPVNGQYTIDRWNCYLQAAGKYTVQQVADAPPGFVYSLKYTSTSAYSAPSTEYFMNTQRIEGYNLADLAWGTANAKGINLSFWAKSSLTGTFGLVLQSNAGDANYLTTYTISSANTWTFITIAVPGPTSGTFPTDNTAGLVLRWNLGCGSNYQSSTVNTWFDGGVDNYFTPTSTVSIVAVSGATLQLTGVQFEVGTTATNFDFRSYGTELSLCQRYYETPFQVAGAGGNQVLNTYGANAIAGVQMKQNKRAEPTISLFNSSGSISVGGQSYAPYGYFYLYLGGSTTGYSGWSASAEL